MCFKCKIYINTFKLYFPIFFGVLWINVSKKNIAQSTRGSRTLSNLFAEIWVCFCGSFPFGFCFAITYSMSAGCRSFWSMRKTVSLTELINGTISTRHAFALACPKHFPLHLVSWAKSEMLIPVEVSCWLHWNATK